MRKKAVPYVPGQLPPNQGSGALTVSPNIDLDRVEWEEQFHDDFPDATGEEAREAWERSEDREAAAWLAAVSATPDIPGADEGLKDPDFDYDDEASEWEKDAPPTIAATVAP